MSEEAIQDRITVLGPASFLPKMRRIKRSHHKGVSPFQLIMPRYLFVQMDLPSDRGLVGIIKRYEGVHGWLGASVLREGIPIPIRDTDIERLQVLANDLCQEIVINNDPPKPLSPDTLVRILWAPLQGQLAKIEIDNGIRADLLLCAAGLASKLSLPRELIEAAC